MIRLVLTLMLSLLASGHGLAGNVGKESLDEELNSFEWSGPKAFVDRLKTEKTAPCEFLTGAESKHQKALHVVRRVLLSLSHTSCPTKKPMAEKYIGSNDPLLRAAAVRLADTLPPDQRKEMEPKIRVMKEFDHDPAVASAIAGFYQSK